MSFSSPAHLLLSSSSFSSPCSARLCKVKDSQTETQRETHTHRNRKRERLMVHGSTRFSPLSDAILYTVLLKGVSACNLIYKTLNSIIRHPRDDPVSCSLTRAKTRVGAAVVTSDYRHRMSGIECARYLIAVNCCLIDRGGGACGLAEPRFREKILGLGET